MEGRRSIACAVFVVLLVGRMGAAQSRQARTARHQTVHCWNDGQTQERRETRRGDNRIDADFLRLIVLFAALLNLPILAALLHLRCSLASALLVFLLCLTCIRSSIQLKSTRAIDNVRYR